MNVFISWSGERSRLLANALADLLPDVIQDLKAWMSEESISAGTRWGQEVNEQLDTSNFGVLCLTPENIAAPWLLFEAGSLGKSVSGARVVPYRLGLAAADVPYPLAQFQGVDANEEGTRKLVQSLNDALEQPMEENRLARIFQRWWADLESRINAIPPYEGPKRASRPDRELLEEILKLMRDQAKPVQAPEPDPEAYSEFKIPKSAIWKTLTELREADLERLTDEELGLYLAKVHKRDTLTPHHGEEIALYQAEERAKKELARRQEQQPEQE